MSRPAPLQHKKFANVFSIGDSNNVPTSKRGAAIRKQSPTLVKNLLALMNKLEPTSRYDGYTSCPLITGYGRLVIEVLSNDQGSAKDIPEWVKKVGHELVYSENVGDHWKIGIRKMK